MDLTFVDNNIDLTTDDNNNNEKKEDVFKIPMTPAESQANTTTTTTTTTTSNTNKDTIFHASFYRFFSHIDGIFISIASSSCSCSSSSSICL